MSTPTRFARTVVFRHLNYRWTLLGLSAGAWLAVLGPAAVYLALTQLLQPWAGAVPWSAFGVATLLGGFAGRAWAAACGGPEPSRGPAVLGAGGCCSVLGWLACSPHGLPAWPAFSLAAAAATYAVGLQFRRPPGALARLAAGLWAPHQLLAGPGRQPGAGTLPNPPAGLP